MICRGTPQDILRNSGCETSLHVHRHLMFCAMYNKHKAAVCMYRSKSRPCLSFATVERVTAVCERNPNVRIWRCVEPHKNGLFMPQLT